MPVAATNEVRWRFDVRGIVQGVGFRPFVHGLAREHRLVGWVENTGSGVVVEAQGRRADVEAFALDLSRRAPPLARVETVERQPRQLVAATDFVIVASEAGAVADTMIPPDVATCDACLAELADPLDRRFRYPFINCTNCGPRYSIITTIPYDRPNTTMAGFALCARCRADYDDPLDRRFHAQPVCCARCGPRLSSSVADAADALRRGEIVAIKGLGGYHLAIVASDEAAARRLRTRKRRADKPFALMVATVADAERLCILDGAERELLASIERPIVLARRRDDAAVASMVAPGTAELGVMLAYTALHRLLLDELGEPIVCTSGNLSDEPIAYRDDDARARLATIADSFLAHDRPIHIRVEDSVARVVDGSPYLLRRSRGYAPAPIPLPWAAPRPVLACGAELKNTIAYHRGRHVVLSHHIGDLQRVESYAAFLEAIRHLGALFQIEPAIVARDLHPQYLSSSYATERDDVDHVVVQHHHAHVAACLADNEQAGPAIGVAFDGIGYGDDGTIWGGEFLVADLLSYRRAGWFSPVPMPGGDAATREPWRMAASYLDACGLADTDGLALAERHTRWPQVLQLARSGLRAPLTSSAGRLFDAVAAVLDVRDVARYEGQAAIELEQLAEPGDAGAYRAAVHDRPARHAGEPTAHVVQGADFVAAAVADRRGGVARDRIAARFHRGMALAVLDVCERIRRDTGIDVVALTGGVFLNVVLLRHTIRSLESAGFVVLRHRRVPCNDGGISFGQAAVAAARDRADETGSSW